MVDFYSIKSAHFDHLQESNNIVISKDDPGKARPQRFTLPGEPHLYGKAIVRDPESASMIQLWQGHEPSARQDVDRQYYEKINKKAVVEGQVGTARDLADFRARHDFPLIAPESPRQKPFKAGGGLAGKVGAAHSNLTPVMTNEYSRMSEKGIAERYEKYARIQGALQEPLKFKLTKSARYKLATAPQRRQPECNKERWLISKFKNVPSHFEQDGTKDYILGRSNSAPTVSANNTTAMVEEKYHNSEAGNSAPLLQWPHKPSASILSASAPAASQVSRQGPVSQVASTLPSDLGGKQLSMDALQKVFQNLDKHGSGVISAAELVKELHGEKPQARNRPASAGAIGVKDVSGSRSAAVHSITRPASAPQLANPSVRQVPDLPMEDSIGSPTSHKSASMKARKSSIGGKRPGRSPNGRVGKPRIGQRMPCAPKVPKKQVPADSVLNLSRPHQGFRKTACWT